MRPKRPTTALTAATTLLTIITAAVAAEAIPVIKTYTDLRHHNIQREDADFVYYVVDPPNSVYTEARSINTHGQIVGFYRLVGQTTFTGFLYYQGNYAPITLPGAVDVYPLRINNQRTIVGTATSPDGRYHGFILKGGQIAIVDDPAATNTVITGINDKDEIVGYSFDTPDEASNFVGDVAHAKLQPLTSGVCIWDINNAGAMVGDSIGSTVSPTAKTDSTATVGKYIAGGTVQDISVGRRTTKAYGINNGNDVVGTYSDPHGFLIHKGQTVMFDVPGSEGVVGTQAFGIDDIGRIVGVYQEPSNDSRGEALHGFLAVPKTGQYSQNYEPRADPSDPGER